MAIIREKQNFQIGTIGVARASEAGQITGKAISESANKIGGMLFEKAADEAEKAGLELGQSVDREQVIAINPQTGEPEAYDPPQGMGTIAADAYQRVVMTRFQRSIEDEIQNKARELSVRYEDSSNGVALYTTAMSEYISSMTNVAQDEFKGYINDVGTSYLNSTRTSMAAAQLRRERAAAARAQRIAVAEGLQNMEAIAARLGSNAFGPDGVGATLSSQVQSSISDAIDANLFNDEVASTLKTAQVQALGRGYLQFISNNPSTSMSDLRAIQAAFNTQTPSLIPNGYPELQVVARQLSENPSAFRDMEGFSDGIFSERIQYRQNLIDANVARIQQQDEITAEQIGRESVYLPSQLQESFANLNNPSAFAYIANEYANFEIAGRNIASESGPRTATQTSGALVTARQNFVESAFTVVANRSFAGLGSNDIDALQYAIATNDRSRLPSAQRDFLEGLDELEAQTNIPLTELYNNLAQTYSGQGGAFVDTLNAEEAERLKLLADAEEEERKRLEGIEEGLNLFDTEQTLSSETQDFGSSVLDFAQNGQIDLAVQAISNRDNSLIGKQRDAISQGNEDLGNVFGSARDPSFNTAINMLAAQAVAGLTQEKTDLVRSALSNPDVNVQVEEIQRLRAEGVINSTSASSFIAAIRAGESLLKSADVSNLLDTALESHRSGPARGEDLIIKSQADALERRIAADTQIMSVAGDVGLRSNIEAKIQELEEINPDAAATFRSGLNQVTARINIANFFSNTRLTGNQSILGSMVLNGLDSERIVEASKELRTELSADQISLLQEVRRDALSSPNAKEIIATEYNRLEGIRADNEAESARVEAERQLLTDVFSGNASATSDDAQNAVQAFSDKQFPNVSAFNLLTDIEYASQNPQALQIALLSPVLPSSTVNLFNQFGAGRVARLDGSQIESILSNWQNMSTITRNGVEISNPSIQAVSEESRAVLDYLTGASIISGSRDSESILQAYALYQRNSNDPAFRAAMTENLDVDSLEKFVVNQFDGENYNARMYSVAENVALAMYSTGASVGDIEDSIARQLETSFPSGGGIVFGDNMSDGTEYSLTITVPHHQDVFVDVLSDRISSATGDRHIQIGDRTFLQSITSRGITTATGSEGPIARAVARAVEDPVELLLEGARALPFGNDLADSFSDGDTPTVTPNLVRYFLRPVAQKSDSGAIGYTVFRMPDVAGTGNRLVYEDAPLDPRADDAERSDVERRPMIIYSDDPVFVSRARSAQAALDAQYLQEGELSKNYELNAYQQMLAGTTFDRREPPSDISTPGLDQMKPLFGRVGDIINRHLFSGPYNMFEDDE